MSNSLQRLILESRSASGLSYADIAARGQLSRSTVYYLATTDPLQRSPSASTLRKLARGLELPEEVVRLAAAEAVGLHAYTEPADGGVDPELQVLIASMERLDVEQRQHVAALVRSLLKKED